MKLTERVVAISMGVKAFFIIVGIVCLFGVTAMLVKAASSGEDFSWLSASDGGIWIGESGSEGDYLLGTEKHTCCSDTSTWNKPAQYTITLKVTDYANPGDADINDYENRWVKDEYVFAENISTTYSFYNDMVFYKTGEDVWIFDIVIPE